MFLNCALLLFVCLTCAIATDEATVLIQRESTVHHKVAVASNGAIHEIHEDFPDSALGYVGIGASRLLVEQAPLRFLGVGSDGALFNALLRLPGICHRLPESFAAFSREELEVKLPKAPTICPGLWSSDLRQGKDVIALRRPGQNAPSETDYVRALLGEPDLGVPERQAPSNEEVWEAIQRLRRAAFVGIFERWELSVCLLHAMFGGMCRHNEFDGADLGDGLPAIDNSNRIYEEAVALFEAKLETYNVNDASCKPCLRQAGVLPFEEDYVLRPTAIGVGGSTYLDKVLPISWLHIPKTGTSLFNAILRLPGVCQDRPDDFELNAVAGGHDFIDEFKNNSEWDWAKKCRGLWEPDDPRRGPCGSCHYAVGQYFDDHIDGHGVTMLRQPEKRIVSMYNHFAKGKWQPITGEYTSVTNMANKTMGCYVRMLAFDDDAREKDICFRPPPEQQLTQTDVQLALHRLSQFAFVGITDHWDLSICLWHAMFGGECHGSEFLNARPGSFYHETGSHVDTSVEALEHGFTDIYDTPVYELGMKMFKENLFRFGVSKNSCLACFREAGVNATSIEDVF